MKQNLSDSIAKLNGGFTLDLNLERNRSNEMVKLILN